MIGNVKLADLNNSPSADHGQMEDISVQVSCLWLSGRFPGVGAISGPGLQA